MKGRHDTLIASVCLCSHLSSLVFLYFFAVRPPPPPDSWSGRVPKDGAGCPRESMESLNPGKTPSAPVPADPRRRASPGAFGEPWLPGWRRSGDPQPAPCGEGAVGRGRRAPPEEPRWEAGCHRGSARHQGEATRERAFKEILPRGGEGGGGRDGAPLYPGRESPARTRRADRGGAAGASGPLRFFPAPSPRKAAERAQRQHLNSRNN